MKLSATMALMLSLALVAPMWGQDDAAQAEQDAKPDTEQEERFAAFEKMLEKTVLVGTFIIDGDDAQDRKPERYEIRRVTKTDRGAYWSFFARIAYGDYDVTVPVPVEVIWAGSTPVITVDNLTIPGLGTFDARVLMSDKKYAGTWRHGKVGGLMFGHIEKQVQQAPEEAGKPEGKPAEDPPAER